MRTDWVGKRVLVVGASGFIGAHVISALRSKGADVTAAVSLQTSNQRLTHIFGDFASHIHVVRADLMNAKDCRELALGKEIVFHFAALDGGSAYKKAHAKEIFRTNTTLVKNIVDASVANRVSRLLIMSSIDVYKKGETKMSESSPLVEGMADSYAWAKVVSERYAQKAEKKSGIHIAIIRAGNVYGPGDTLDPTRMRMIPRFITAVLKDQPISVWGKKTDTLSLLYVDDFVGAALAAVLNADNEPINIAGKPVAFATLISAIGRAAGKKPDVRYASVRNVTLGSRIDTMRAKSLLRFRQRTPLRQGILQTVRYVRKEGHL